MGCCRSSFALSGDRREHDVLTPPSDAAWIAEHTSGTKVVEISGAGHMSPMERPLKVSEAIRAFWRQG